MKKGTRFRGAVDGSEGLQMIYYSAQTLEQMRLASKLTLEDPPQRVPVFLPDCSAEDFSCPWPSFAKTLNQAIDPHYVSSR